MRGFQTVFAAATLALLPACNLLAVGSGGETEPGSRNSAASDTKAEPADDTGNASRRAERREEEPARNESRADEPRARSASTDQEWILGRWGNAGCATVLDFQSDGTLTIDDVAGRWSLDGDTLTMSGNGQEQVLTVTRESGGFSIEDSEGNVQELGRC